MSMYERMSLMHERMTIRNLDIQWFMDVCNSCANDMSDKLEFWTAEKNELSFLVECVFGDVLHEIEKVRKSIQYLERLMEEEE